MKTTVTITQRHLDNQVRGDCYRCAVALALNEVLDPAFNAYVLGDRWRLASKLDVRLLTRPLPFTIQDFINTIDREVPKTIQLSARALPLTFETDIPRKYRCESY